MLLVSGHDVPALKRLLKLKIVWTSALSISILIALALGIQTPDEIRLDRGERLLVADFLNEAGDPEGGPRLKQVLYLLLSQSDHFLVFPETEVQASLEQLSRGVRPAVNAGIALQVCAAEKIPVFVLPRISRGGGSLILSLKIVEVKNNRITRELLADTVRERGEGGLLVSLENVCRRIRRTLGEPETSPAMRGQILPGPSEAGMDAMRLFSRALLLDSRQEYEGELALLKEAIGIAPEFAAARMQLAAVWHNLGLEDAKLEELSRAMAGSPRLPPREMYRLRGSYLSARREFAQAQKEFETLAAIFPGDWQARVLLAECLFNMCDYARSAAEYKQAVQLNGYAAAPHLGLCLAHLFLGNTAAARLAWERATALDSGSASIYEIGAMLELVESNVGAALRALERVVPGSQRRSVGTMANLLAQPQIYGGRFQEARRLLREAIDEASRRGSARAEATARLALARLHLLTGETSQAKSEADRVVRLEPDAAFLAGAGIVRAQLRDVDGAQEILRRIESHPGLPEISWQRELLRGEIQLALGRWDQSIQSMTLAKRLAPNHPPMEPLARAFSKAGKHAEASSEYSEIQNRKAEALFPPGVPWFAGTWVSALFDAGKCSLALGRKREAQQYFRNYLWALDGADPGVLSIQEARQLLKKPGFLE